MPTRWHGQLRQGMDGHGWLGCGQEAEVTRIAGEYLPTAPGDRLCRDHGIDGVGSARSAQERSSHSTDLGMCRLDPPDVVQHTMNARIRRDMTIRASLSLIHI